MDDGSISPCPICMKGKYTENALIQHLLDKHPEFPGTRKLNSEYQFPTVCSLCGAKILTGVAMMTHYDFKHPDQYQQFKAHLGFDFKNPDSSFCSGDAIEILSKFPAIPVHFIQINQDMYTTINSLIKSSPILFATLQICQFLVMCCTQAILILDSKSPRLGEYIDQYINKKVPIISLTTPNETKTLADKNIHIATNISSSPFSCQEYIEFIREYGPPLTKFPPPKIDMTNLPSKNDIKEHLISIALAYFYLQDVKFFPQVKASKKAEAVGQFACPCCQVVTNNIVSLYRHLYRIHPMTSAIMNQYKLSNQPKGVFICDQCHFRDIHSFDDLIIHVFNEHREELLAKTLRQLESRIQDRKQNPQLYDFIQNELAILRC